MSEPETFTGLCVGGPRDGQRFETRNPQGFTVPVMRPNGVIEHHYYRAERFYTPTTNILIWTPQNQTIEQTMAMLLQTYMEAKS